MAIGRTAATGTAIEWKKNKKVGSSRGFDNAAAEDDFLLIKDRRLARCDGRYGFGEDDLRQSSGEG